MSVLTTCGPPALALAVRGFGATWRIKTDRNPQCDPFRKDRSENFVYALWHRTVLVNIYLYRGLDICAGVSQHADGELASRTAERLGFRTARGSSTRGAARLVREMMRLARGGQRDISLTPDGPKGPSEKSKPGILYLAARLGWKIVPIGVAVHPFKALNSWDRFIIPAPFAKVASVTGEPMELQRDLSEDDMKELCVVLDRRMQEAEQHARGLL